MRRLLATTTLSLAFVAAPACDKKEEEKKDATAKKADKKADADKGKAGDEKKAAADGGAAKADGGEAKADGGEAPAAGGGAATAAAGGALIDYVPDAAKVLAVINLEGLVKSEVYKGAAQAALDSGPFGKNLASAKACNLGLETWKQLVIGADPDAKDTVVMGMGAAGIGKKENIECIAGKYKEQDAKADWKIEEKDGRVVVTIDGGDAVVYSAGDDAVVMTSKSWDAAVQERLGGKGTAAASGSLKDALALADTTKFIYVAGLANADMASGPLTGAKAFGASLDVSDGVALAAAVSFADAAAATAQAAAITAQFNGVKPMAASFGVPQGLVDSVKIEAKDANVTVSAKASATDIEALTKSAGGMMR